MISSNVTRTSKIVNDFPRRVGFADDQCRPDAGVIESSKRLGINPKEYLADVLRRLANGTTLEVPSLTPAAWLRSRSGKQLLNHPGDQSTEGLADRRHGLGRRLQKR